jgi:hypothetical protein
MRRSDKLKVHIFFIDGSSGQSIDSYLRLSANQTATFFASDIDPGVVGYVLAVAVHGSTGWPVSFNHLIGDEHVRLASGHAAELSAEAFTAGYGPDFTALPGYAETSREAQLIFGSPPPGACSPNPCPPASYVYSPAPLVLALDNIQSPEDGNATLLIINGIGGDLLTTAAPVGPVVGTLLSDADLPFTFTHNGSGVCQLRQVLSNGFPRVAGGLTTVIPRGKCGWLKLWSRFYATAFLGAVINFNSGQGQTSAAFSGGHNLPKLELMPYCFYRH